jgi:peroxiredoxin
VLSIAAISDLSCEREAALSDPEKLPKPQPDTLPTTTSEAFALASGMNASLKERLATYRQHSGRLRPEIAALYQGLVDHLEALVSGAVGPAVGDAMPDFLLPDQHGQLVSLENLLQSGPVVVSMNRGHWCPYCRLDLRAMAQIEPDIRRLGAQIVSIMPEKAQYTKRAIADNAFPFPILTDVDLGYALSLGLVFWVGADVKKLYGELGLDLAVFQGNASYFLPIAAKFVIDRDGKVKAREINVNFRERMEPSEIIAALERL